MNELEKIYGIKIDNSDYFERALTHPSYTQEKELPYNMNYERLEFLGDAVLKLVSSQILFEKYPDYTEGEMSKIRSVIVSDSILSKIACKIGLNDLIKASVHNEKQGIKKVESVCACAFEAVLGAFYLDGKLDEVKSFLKKVLVPYFDEVENNFARYNAKAILQEYTQSVNQTTPVYEVVASSGPQHNKTFVVEVSFHDEILAKGEGKSKKDAEQHAAYEACKKLGVIE